MSSRAKRKCSLKSHLGISGLSPRPQPNEPAVDPPGAQSGSGTSRRTFLAQMGALAGGAVAAEMAGSIAAAEAGTDWSAQGGSKAGTSSGPSFAPPALPAPPAIPGCEVGPLGSMQRAIEARNLRNFAAKRQFLEPDPTHVCNGDEDLYPNKIASYSKGLPHNALGEVDLAAYETLMTALASGDPADFEAITLGCGGPTIQRKQVNPQAGLAFEMIGADAHHVPIPPAPAFVSAEEAGEIVENYWMALTRDVPFADYGADPLSLAAASDLSTMSDFRGPKVGGVVTSDTLFRGTTPGDLTGPYISQFLWRPTPFGAEYVERRMRTRTAGVDYMTSYADWLDVQNGCLPGPGTFEPVRRYISNGRDLSEWVHIDVLFQAYFNAFLILITPPDPDPNVGGIGAPSNPGNPYVTSHTQEGFGTLGPPGYATVLCEVAARALKAVWFTKWYVHRRLRPEVFAGRIHNHVTGAATYPIHADALNSAALTEVFNLNGTYLLPMAFPEGSPLHPAYGAGHATVAGACVTILKALFDENFVIPNPVVPDPNDLTQLVPYVGPALTVGGELNKVASNVAIGRNIAGVHWRTDASASLALGEAIAIAVLRDHAICYNEDFAGFTFTKFDGTLVTVS